MNLNTALAEFGLTGKEAKVYLKLLEKGSITSGELMRELQMYSKTIYEILGRLVEKGIASYVIKANTKYFEAERPEKFLDIIDEEEEKLEAKREEIKKIIPELNLKRKLSKEPQEATIYKGKKGIKSIFDQMLKQNGDLFVIGSGKFSENLGPYAKLWHKKRAKAGIKLNILWSKKSKGDIEKMKSNKLINMKVLPPSFENPAGAIVFEDKVAIIVWGEVPIATLIRSKEVARSYKSYFDVLWKSAKK